MTGHQVTMGYWPMLLGFAAILSSAIRPNLPETTWKRSAEFVATVRQSVTAKRAFNRSHAIKMTELNVHYAKLRRTLSALDNNVPATSLRAGGFEDSRIVKFDAIILASPEMPVNMPRHPSRIAAFALLVGWLPRLAPVHRLQRHFISLR